MSDAAASLLAGRYRLDREWCASSHAMVWCATDMTLNRTVIISVLTEASDAARSRLRDKARLTGTLSHPGITRVYDFATSHAGFPPFLVTEYVDGPSMAQLMAGGPIGVTGVLDLVAQAAWVLDAAHRAGLRHGAIKPSNVLVRRDGKVKLTDFGGTAEDDFLAPELPEGAGATVAGDLYALGVLARKCLAGAAGMTGSATHSSAS